MVARRDRRRPAWGKIALIALAIGALAAAWRWTPLADYVTAQNILRWTRAVRGTWWAPLAMIAAYIPGSLVLFPRPILTLVSVITFGTWLGLAYATAGVLLAALATYWTGRLLNRDVVKRIAGDNLDAAAKPVKAHGVVTMFAANMMPTPPFAVQNVIAGAIRMKLWEFMLGTFLALIPGMIAWAAFGRQVTAALEEASASYWIMGAAVLLLALFIFLARWWLKRKGF